MTAPDFIPPPPLNKPPRRRREDPSDDPAELMRQLERKVLVDLAWCVAFFALGYLVGKFA